MRPGGAGAGDREMAGAEGALAGASLGVRATGRGSAAGQVPAPASVASTLCVLIPWPPGSSPAAHRSRCGSWRGC